MITKESVFAKLGREFVLLIHLISFHKKSFHDGNDPGVEKRTSSCRGLPGATAMFRSPYVVEFFPVEIRNVGVGMSYNIGFCIFGGFAPLICEASHDVAPWAPGCFFSVAGVITASTVLLSLRLQSRGVLCLAPIRADPYFEASSCKSKVTRDCAKDQSVKKGGEEDAQATEQAKCKKGELTEMTEENFQTVL